MGSKRALALVATVLLAAGLAACASSASPSTTSSATLVMESSPENSVTQDFNPFVPTVAPQGMGATGLIYEPLYQFDLANPTINYRWLATDYQWGDGRQVDYLHHPQRRQVEQRHRADPRGRGFHLRLHQAAQRD